MDMLKVFIIAMVAVSLTSCDSTDSNPTDSNFPGITTEYTNTDLQISAVIPAGWDVIENRTPTDDQAVNIFPDHSELARKLPLGLHEEGKHSYIVIRPGGLGTEFPSGTTESFSSFSGDLPTTRFSVNQTKSKVFLTDKREVWALFIIPDSLPQGWHRNGFIFAQVGLNDFSAKCLDKESGQVKDMDKCDPMMGDRVVRKGNVRSKDKTEIYHILENLNFSASVDKPVTDLIKVENPMPNAEITSPLTVKGSAVGFWYFEGSFTVELYDARHNLLTEAIAQADGEWMTESFVPFASQLTFKAPENQRGRLVFVKANPSGLPDKDRSFELPVLFSKKGS